MTTMTLPEVAVSKSWRWGFRSSEAMSRRSIVRLKVFIVNNDSLLNVQCVYFIHHHDYFHTLIKGDSKQLQKFKIEDQIKDFLKNWRTHSIPFKQPQKTRQPKSETRILRFLLNFEVSFWFSLLSAHLIVETCFEGFRHRGKCWDDGFHAFLRQILSAKTCPLPFLYPIPPCQPLYFLRSVSL